MSSKLLLLLALISVIAAGLRFLPHRGLVDPHVDEQQTADRRRENFRIDTAALAQRLAGPLPLTEDQVAEDERIDAEQVARARRWLASSDRQQRIAGAEQLSAYPTAEAEHLAIHALAMDRDAAVRGAAAQSLESFERPSAAAIGALLAALQDPDAAVRMSALSTLQEYLADDTLETGSHAKVVAGLRKLRNNRRVDKQTRHWVAAFLSDLEPARPVERHTRP